LRQVDGGAEADRTGADHDHRVARRARSILIAGAPVGEPVARLMRRHRRFSA